MLRCAHLLMKWEPQAVIALANATLGRLPPDWQVARSFLLFSLAGA